MTERSVHSTLKAPPRQALSRFHVGQVGDDTIQTFLDKGWSLAICCKSCERLVEWTPVDLTRRFKDKAGLRVAELVPRLSCGGDEGCGSRDIAVFPHLYDGGLSNGAQT